MGRVYLRAWARGTASSAESSAITGTTLTAPIFASTSSALALYAALGVTCKAWRMSRPAWWGCGVMGGGGGVAGGADSGGRSRACCLHMRRDARDALHIPAAAKINLRVPHVGG